MTIIEDTRNKEGKHDNVKAYCERHGAGAGGDGADCGADMRGEEDE